MEILRYHGLDLPVFDTSIVLAQEEFINIADKTRAEMEKGNKPVTTFVRTAEPYSRLHNETLKSRLNHASEAFKVIEEVCECKVINYTYGFCKDNGEIQYNRKTLGDLLPKGYLLVAEVDIILEDINPANKQARTDALYNYVERYMVLRDLQKAFTPENGYQFLDYMADQTMYGVSAADHLAAPTMWFVDIEPIKL